MGTLPPPGGGMHLTRSSATRPVVGEIEVNGINMRRRIQATTAGIFILTALAGCASTKSNGNGIVFGCDGSGAGVLLRWDVTAMQGARDGGFAGEFHNFQWQTGLGVVADHSSPVGYKQNAGKKLAKLVTEHHEKYPSDPIYISGLSAGCAVAIYALEQLPDDVHVEQVFLSSPSVSDDYDLTEALSRVDGKLYAFTSERDAILKVLAARVGTADGKFKGEHIAGLRGFIPPDDAAAATRRLYERKVENFAWMPEFAKYGHYGGHTDVMSSKFVAHYVAPLMKPAASSARITQATTVSDAR